MKILGVDCSTDPKKTGLALAELDADGIVHVSHCCTGSKQATPYAIALDWLMGSERVILALDAPLGWPAALSKSLIHHKAGEHIKTAPNELFRRLTDDEIHRRLGKRPLDVAADRIARTAASALSLLDEMRLRSGHQIPLLWSSDQVASWGAIEVYPAATMIGHGAINRYQDSFKGYLRAPPALSLLEVSEHELDAMICALAAADFMRGVAVAPTPDQTNVALVEGWIWARPPMQ